LSTEARDRTRAPLSRDSAAPSGAPHRPIVRCRRATRPAVEHRAALVAWEKLGVAAEAFVEAVVVVVGKRVARALDALLAGEAAFDEAFDQPMRPA
jgi:hypothetical protein